MTRLSDWRRLWLVGVLAMALGLPWLALTGYAAAQAAEEQYLYLPTLYGPLRLAGVYDCVEYEAGQVWATDVITLHPTGDSEYATHGPFGGVVTGTWLYTPTTHVLGFTEFRWEAVSVELTMEHLWASRWIEELDYEFRLDCHLRLGP